MVLLKFARFGEEESSTLIGSLTVIGVPEPDPVRASRETYRVNYHRVSWQHGWPLRFAKRTLRFTGVYPGQEPWDKAQVVEWDSTALALDVGICAGVAVAIGLVGRVASRARTGRKAAEGQQREDAQ